MTFTCKLIQINKKTCIVGSVTKGETLCKWVNYFWIFDTLN